MPALGCGVPTQAASLRLRCLPESADRGRGAVRFPPPTRLRAVGQRAVPRLIRGVARCVLSSFSGYENGYHEISTVAGEPRPRPGGPCHTSAATAAEPPHTSPSVRAAGPSARTAAPAWICRGPVRATRRAGATASRPPRPERRSARWMTRRPRIAPRSEASGANDDGGARTPLSAWLPGTGTTTSAPTSARCWSSG